HALTQRHHAGAVTRRIKWQPDRQQTARVSVAEECHPRTPQRPTGMLAAQFDVSLGVVKMADLKRPISMTRRSQFQLPIKSLPLIRRPPALTFECLLH